jgi:integrase
VPKTALTDLSLRKLQPPAAGQMTYWDTNLTGFGVRLSQGGSKSFILMHGKCRERTTIGRVGVITLKDARDAARRILAENTLGKHRLARVTFEKAVDIFLAECEQRNRPRTVSDYKRILNRHFMPKLRLEIMEDITRASITKIIDGLAETPAEQNYAFRVIRLFMRTGVRRGQLTLSPCANMRLPARPASRDRVLTDAELKTIWQAAEGTFGQIVKLLILTGQRRGEIAALKKEYIDPKARTITLPGSVTKNGREHTFPYGRIAYDVSTAIPEHSRPFLLSASGYDNAFNGFSKAKRELDKVCNIAPWTLHDLRRTFATNLARLGVAPHIVERLLNHASGTISGVAGIYNRFKYLDEMRAAIALWDQKLQSLIGPVREAA